MNNHTGIKRVVGPTILLASGTYFDFESPETSEITIEDIAQGLSKICRFTGQCVRFYSVAEHSVLCSRIVPPDDAYAALMHDAAEAVMGDVSRPLKSLLPDYRRIEQRVEAAIFDRFGLPPHLPQTVKAADMRMLAVEQREAMQNGDDWGLEQDCGEPPLRFLPPFAAFHAFMVRYSEVRPRG